MNTGFSFRPLIYRLSILGFFLVCTFVRPTARLLTALAVWETPAAFPQEIDLPLELGQLTASDGIAGDALGSALAMDGDLVVAGAAGDDDNQGAVYVYLKPTSGWTSMTQVAKLTASDGIPEDWFGYSVAVSGDTIVVGCLGGMYGNSPVLGSVYVFVKPPGGWADMVQTAKLTPSNGIANDQFGYAVAIQGDTVAVGAIYASKVYLFEKPQDGWVDMTETAQLTSGEGPADERLGASLAFDGDTLIAGAPGTTSYPGSAYVFVKPPEGWSDMTESAQILPSDGQNEDLFGTSLALEGDTLVVGAPYDSLGYSGRKGVAYIFIKPPVGWGGLTQTAKLTASDGSEMDWFGWSLALAGKQVFVGAAFNQVGDQESQGSVYIYEKPAGGWADSTEDAQLTASDGAAGDGFGWSLALDEDTLAVGAYTNDVGANQAQGSVYLFAFEPPYRLHCPLVRR